MSASNQIAQSGPSSTRTLAGTGKILCVICGIRPHYNDGRRSFPTCGNTCGRKLKEMTGVQAASFSFGGETQSENRPPCIICKRRPQFNNGRRAFPTCGNTCARLLQDMSDPSTDFTVGVNVDGPLTMCYVCNIRPRHQRGWKVYPTCGLTCAARLHSRDRCVTVQTGTRNTELDHPSLVQPSVKGKARAVEGHPTKAVYENEGGFECTICLEILPIEDVARFSCRHPFCRSCLKGHVVSEINEHRYPIICPLCKIEDKATEPSTVDDQMLQILGLGDEVLTLFYELQLAAHSIAIHCQRCRETMFVDRREYEENTIIECPLPRCNHIWCKHCHMEVRSKGPPHSCDGSSELEHLMKENGWRHCPGCQTPVQKSDGCNHMSCLAPGCNSHFCYQCGANIIRSLRSTDIRAAVTAHYSACQLF